MAFWDRVGPNQYVGLHPWVWAQLESAEPPGPFPFMGGVAPDVVASLHEVHGVLMSAVETAISDVWARRAPVDDPARGRRLEDAYAEVVRSRPRLREHIQCERRPDGAFLWDFPRDAERSAVMRYGGVRVFNAVTRQTLPMGFDPAFSPVVGQLLGWLNGAHTVSALHTMVTTAGRDHARRLTEWLEQLAAHECLAMSDASSIRARWLDVTHPRDVVHLGHAALMYRRQDDFLWFDPWLMPWFAESSAPSLWTSLLPPPAAVFLTHDHDDHVDPRTLLHLPKDVPVIVPSRKNRTALYFDYPALLRELGFTHVTELAHGESWTSGNTRVVSVPFFGEDPCDLALPRNCYLICDDGHNTLVHADSGPTNAGISALSEGVIADLVRRYGPIATVFASQQQLKEIRAYAAHACVSHPGAWLETGENGFLTNEYLAALMSQAQAKLFVSYATGGADWYPDHLSFMFSRRNPARTALLTAHWEPPASLGDLLRESGRRYHHGRALDVIHATAPGDAHVTSHADALAPLALYQRDHTLPAALAGDARQ